MLSWRVLEIRLCYERVSLKPTVSLSSGDDLQQRLQALRQRNQTLLSRLDQYLTRAQPAAPNSEGMAI